MALSTDIRDYTLAAIKAANKNIQVTVGREGPEGVPFAVKHNNERYVFFVKEEDGFIVFKYPAGRGLAKSTRPVKDVDKHMDDVKVIVQGIITKLRKSA